MNKKRCTKVLCVLMTCIFAIGLIGCGDKQETQTIEAIPRYESPYDFSNLNLEGERFVYSKNDERASKTGIDISEHNRTINWYSVAQDEIDFAMIRIGNRGATEGVISLDDYYYENIDAAKAAGLDVGVYFFSQAMNADEGREEAEFVLQHLEGRELDYPVAFDHEPLPELEGRADDISAADLTEAAAAFCDTIKQAGYSTMIYGNAGDIYRYEPGVREDYEIWFAEYDTLTPTGQFDFTMWQYTSRGSVAGIETSVDLNIHFLEA